MNADNIKIVLSKIHLAEIAVGRVAAYKQCITGSGLSLSERHVLMAALHIDPSEVGEPPP